MLSIRHKLSPITSRSFFGGSFLPTATLLLLLAMFLSACDLFGGSGTATPTAVSSSNSISSGGSFGGAIGSGGSFGGIAGAAGAAVGSQPGQQNPQAAATQPPSGSIGSLPVGSGEATATSAAQIAAIVPASVAFTVPQESLNIAGRLAYVGNDGRIWTMTAEGTDWRVLVDKPTGDEPPGERVVNLNISPSGKRLLYQVLKTDGSEPRTYMLDLSNGNVTHQIHYGTWSPDSIHLVGSEDGQVVVYNTDSGQEENLGSGTSPNWAAANSLLVYRDGNVWKLEYPGGTGQKLTNFAADGPDAWQFYNVPVYHYSGRILFAGSSRSAQDGMGNGAKIMAIDTDGQMSTLAGPGGSNVRYMSLSPSGTRLSFSEQNTRNGCVSFSTLEFVNATGGSAVKVNIPESDTNFAFLRGIAWSPDQKMVYSYSELSCASGAPVAGAADKLFLVDPASPETPRYIGDGAFPVFVRVWALGQETPGDLFAGIGSGLPTLR